MWLKNLPKLEFELENVLFGEKTAVSPEYVFYNSKKTKTKKSRYSILGKLGKKGSKERSKTFQGIAEAMAKQWGYL